MRNCRILALILILVTGMIGCSSNEKTGPDVEGIPVDFDLVRFDRLFYQGGADALPGLKRDFPYFFPAPNPDSIWLAKMQDEDERYLFQQADSVFGNFEDEVDDLEGLFRHMKYYFPNFEEPRVITVISNVDYNNKVIEADSLLLVSLDLYLGRDHEVYLDFPDYVKQNYNKRQLVVDVAESYARTVLPGSAGNSFLSRIIQKGKEKYFMASIVPEASAQAIMGYSQEQMQWITNNEAEVWKYFVQNELLYSSDPDLNMRFIDPAPFSKFYLEVDKESPGGIGVWYGWQIVKFYADNNDTDLKSLLQTDNEEIFKRSKYKPKK